jgi:drug/metabolite transporter (DMT)-like permease
MRVLTVRWKILIAFAALYLIWGSTYLAIRIAIETLPPFLMAGVRFLAAGALLYGWSVARAPARPSRAEWRAALIIGALLLLGGNGGLVWAEQLVPSGVAALLVAIVPVWMVLLDWLWRKGDRPHGRTIAGLALGFAGLALLVGRDALGGGNAVHPVGALVLMVGSVCWATGSIYAKGAPQPAAPLLATGMQMLAGGAVLVVAGLLTGEVSRLDPGAISLRSLLGFAYLIVFGAVIGFTAYSWLLRVVHPARVATYAYVNPIVAVILGSTLAGEPFTARMAVAALVIITGVLLVSLDAHTTSRRAAGHAHDETRAAA